MEHYELMSVIEPRRKKQYLRVTVSVKTGMCTTPTMRFVHLLSHSKTYPETKNVIFNYFYSWMNDMVCFKRP